MKNSIRSQIRNFALLAIVLFGLLLRLPSVNMPLLDANAWRQTDTAAVARNFYENGFNIFYPQVDWRGASAGYAESEFQIFPFMVALLYKVFGAHDWVGRLVSLIFFIFSTILLFRLASNLFNFATAIWAALFYVISPLNIHFTRAFMPTSMLVFCSIASIYYFSQWIDKNSWYLLLASSIMTALAILIKPPSLYLGLPLLYLATREYKKRTFVQWRMWLFAVLVLLPPFWWYYHAHQLFLSTQLTFGIWGGGYSKFGSFAYWFNIDFYRVMASRVAHDILTLPGLILATVGFLLLVEKKNYVILWWGVAFAIYILIVAEGHQTHYYYQMPLVPILCVYAGQGMNYLWGKDLFKDSFLKNRLSSKGALIALFVLMSFAGVLRTQQYLHYEPQRLAFGKRIEQLTEKDSLIIIGGWNKGRHLQVRYPPRDPIDFYFSNRKGWEINLDNWSLSLVETLKQQGAKYFVTFWPMGLDIKTTFAKDIRQNYQLLEATDRWVICSLTS